MVWFGRRVHPYYLVVWFFVGVIGGMVVGAMFDVRWLASLWALVGAVLLVSVGVVRFRRWTLLCVCLSGCLLGMWRSGLAQIDTQGYSSFVGQTVKVQGVIVDDVTQASNGSTRFKLRDVVVNDSVSLGGEVWVSTRESVQVKRSDTVQLNGFLNEGFGSFAASLGRAELLAVSETSRGDVGLVMRDTFSEGTAAIGEPERSLGLGYLVGLKTALPEDLQQNFQILGLTHVVVASGYNLTILVTFTRRLLARISKYLATASGGVMIAGFILITGFSPSMSRAGLVAGLSLLAWYYGRKVHPVTLLVVAAGVTLLFRPSYIAGDLGWYLSFLAFFGILVFAPLLHHYFWGADKKPSALRELLVATFAAQLMTLPLIIYSFGAFSWYALLANALVLPAIPLSMLATFVAGLAGLFLPFTAQIFALPAEILLGYCTFVVSKVAQLPNVYNELTIGFATVLLSYFLLVALVGWFIKRTGHSFLRDKTIVE